MNSYELKRVRPEYIAGAYNYGFLPKPFSSFYAQIKHLNYFGASFKYNNFLLR